MKLLIATNDPTEIALAQALLDGEGIEAFPLDVHTSALGGGIGILPMRLMVCDGDHDAARSLLRNAGILK